MPVTLGSAGITFSDSTTQTSKGAVLGAVQYTAYRGVNQPGTTYSASVIDTGDAMGAALSPASVVICGVQSYRSGTFTTVDDGAIDSQTVQHRTAYRSIS